jgi:hypothetical protein
MHSLFIPKHRTECLCEIKIIDNGVFFKNLSQKLILNLTRMTGTLHEDQYTFMTISRSGFFNEKFFKQKT